MRLRVTLAVCSVPPHMPYMLVATANTRDMHSFQPIGSFQPVGCHTPEIERVVNVGATRDIVEAAPEYHPDLDFSPACAAELYRHYRRPAAPRPAK